MQTFLWREKMKGNSISQKLQEITVFNIHPLRQVAFETFKPSQFEFLDALASLEPTQVSWLVCDSFRILGALCQVWSVSSTRNKRIDWMDRVDRIKLMDRMNRMDRMDWVDRIDQMNQLDKLDQMDQMHWISISIAFDRLAHPPACFLWIWLRNQDLQFWIALALDYLWMRLPVKDSSVIWHESEFRSWEGGWILIGKLEVAAKDLFRFSYLST